MPEPPSFPFKTEAYVARGGKESPRLEQVTYENLHPNELLVSIVAASVCHTDVRASTGDFHLKPPLILGHEGAGYVLAKGDKVTYVDVGEAVVLSYASCGGCRFCLKGWRSYCESLAGMNFGGKRVWGEGDGGVSDAEGRRVNGFFFGQSSMARTALVHESCCVKVDVRSRGELEMFASLGCGVQTGFGSIYNIAKPPPSSSIVIFGGGAVGLSAIAAARLFSPALLVLVDNSSTKLDMIPKELLEGVKTLNSSGHVPGETATALKALTPNGRGFDFALDCVGNEAVIIEAHTCLDSLGTLINVGSSATAKAGFGIGTHLIRAITMRGTHQGDSVSRVMVPYLISLWREGKFAFDKLLTRYKFEELEKSFEDAHDGKVIKPLLVVGE